MSVLKIIPITKNVAIYLFFIFTHSGKTKKLSDYLIHSTIFQIYTNNQESTKCLCLFCKNLLVNMIDQSAAQRVHFLNRKWWSYGFHPGPYGPYIPVLFAMGPPSNVGCYSRDSIRSQTWKPVLHIELPSNLDKMGKKGS